MPVVLPSAAVELRAEPVAEGPLLVTGTIGLDDFTGKLLVELVGAAGEVLGAEELALAGREFSLEVPAAAAAVAVRAYARDELRGVDAAGGLALVEEPAQPAPRQSRPAAADPSARGRGGS